MAPAIPVPQRHARTLAHCSTYAHGLSPLVYNGACVPLYTIPEHHIFAYPPVSRGNGWRVCANVCDQLCTVVQGFDVMPVDTCVDEGALVVRRDMAFQLGPTGSGCFIHHIHSCQSTSVAMVVQGRHQLIAHAARGVVNIRTLPRDIIPITPYIHVSFLSLAKTLHVNFKNFCSTDHFQLEVASAAGM